VTPRVATEDLLDTQGVAEILGLAHRNTVLQYQQRYGDMPKPVFDLGKGRVKLWLRPEIERWAQKQATRGRTRPMRRSSR
jgi:glutathione-regulated potassium-efflux system ancillary protein KefG